jgi:hypothetical protein
VKILFSNILQGIDDEFIQVLEWSQIIIQNLFNQVSINFHLTGTFMFALSCLRFAVINQQPMFTLFHITESQK